MKAVLVRGNYDRATLSALFEQDRPWSEYDEYREAPAEDSKLSVMIVRDDTVLWSNTMFPYAVATFTAEEREQWCAACFRIEAADGGVGAIEDLLSLCTDRRMRRALKRQSRAITREVASHQRFSARMHQRGARAEREAKDVRMNNKAAAWLRRTSG